MQYVDGHIVSEQMLQELMGVARDTTIPWTEVEPVGGITLCVCEVDDVVRVKIKFLCDVSPELFADTVFYVDEREWNPRLQGYNIVEQYDSQHFIEFKSYASYMLGQSIEYWLYCWRYSNPVAKLFVRVFRSIHCSKPGVTNLSLTPELHPSGYIIEGTDNDQKCQVTFLYQQDQRADTAETALGDAALQKMCEALKTYGYRVGGMLLLLRDYVLQQRNIDSGPHPLLMLAKSTEREWEDSAATISEAQGWTCHVKKYGLAVYTKIGFNDTIFVTTGRIYSGASPSQLYSIFSRVEGLQAFDPFLESAEVLERIENNISVVRLQSRSLTSMGNKDLLCFLRVQRVEPGEQFVEVFRSIPHPSVTVHARNYLPSGAMFSPYKNGTVIRYHFQISISNTNLAGLDSSALSRLLSARAVSFFNSVRSKLEPVSTLQLCPLPDGNSTVTGYMYLESNQLLVSEILNKLDINKEQSALDEKDAQNQLRKRRKPTQWAATLCRPRAIADINSGTARPFLLLQTSETRKRVRFRRTPELTSESPLVLLVTDVQLHILELLTATDLLVITNICKYFHFLANGNKHLWQHAWRNQFRSIPQVDNWRKYFSSCMKMRHDWQSGKLSSHRLSGHTGTVHSLSLYEYNGLPHTLFTGSTDRTSRVWMYSKSTSMVQASSPIASIHIPELVCSCAGTAHMQQQPNTIIVAHTSGVVEWWDWLSHTKIGNATYGQSMDGMIFLDPTRLVITWDDCTVNVWDMHKGNNMCTFNKHTRRVNNVAAIAESLILSASADKLINLLDVRTPNEVVATFEGHTRAVNTLAVFGDNRTIISGASDTTIRIWDLRNGALGLLGKHQKPVRVAKIADADMVASAGDDGRVCIWDVAGNYKSTTQQPLKSFIALNGNVHSLAVCGSHAFCGGTKGELVHWAVNSKCRDNINM